MSRTMESAQAREALQTLALRPAVVTIDLHRGHLDPEVATLPLPAAAAGALMQRVVPLLDELRALGVPLIHVVTSYRNREEILSNPYWRFQAGRRDSARAAIAEHNLEGLPGLELMPGVQRDGDAVVMTKKRYDCLLGTDLEMALDAGRHDSILAMGVNTNSCVLATSIAASVRNYAVFVVEDGVDTMLARQLHDAALSTIDASFGWIVGAETLLDVLAVRAARRPAFEPTG
jgi:nicotinamidase-related amidase